MTDSKEEAEKLFQPSNNSEVKATEEIKFISEAEGKNGITPITLDSVKTAFTGLTKEELMKYANDPFWVRIRWILFVLFWVVWFLMLFGAVFIIIVTPKCQKPSPLSWWELNPLHVIDVNTLVPDESSKLSSLDILKSRMKFLNEELGVKSILLKSVLETKDGSYDEVLNFTSINHHLGSLDKFRKEILEFATSRDIKLLLGFTPNYSGKNNAFVRSELKEDGYVDYYVWHPNNYTSKPDKPPNNWKSVYNTSAWEWDETRKQFYLHQFAPSQPELNFRNSAVVDMISDVLKHWIDFGMNGIHMDKTEYLLEDTSFTDEETDRKTVFSMNEYGFYRHFRTRELPDNVDLLERWSKIIKSKLGIVSVSGGVLEKTNIVNYILRPLTLSENFTAVELRDKIVHWSKSVNYSTWQWKCASSRSNYWSTNVRSSLIIVSFLLPGIPVLNYEDSFPNPNITKIFDEEAFKNATKAELDEPNSRLNLMKKLNSLRALPAFSYGEFHCNVTNGTVFTFTRIKANNPGYLVVWNLGNSTTTINFEHLSYNFGGGFLQIPEDLSLVVKSNWAVDGTPNIGDKISKQNVVVPSFSLFVFSFVPSSK